MKLQKLRGKTFCIFLDPFEITNFQLLKTKEKQRKKERNIKTVCLKVPLEITSAFYKLTPKTTGKQLKLSSSVDNLFSNASLVLSKLLAFTVRP